jgi:diketogulonate reductase-like aldo/keto reductase
MAQSRLRHDHRQTRLRRVINREEPHHHACNQLLHHPEQRCEDAGPGPWRLPKPSGRDHRCGRHRAAGRLPSDRHRRGVLQRARGRRGHPPVRRQPLEIFIETKLWISDYGYDEALRGFDKGVRKLGVDQVDLLLLHQPLAANFEKTIAAYKAMEQLLAEGRVRAIGVSNQTPAELEELIARTDVVPSVNQIQVHPYYSQPEWRAANDRHGILTQSWSPIGGSYIYGDSEKNPLEDPAITGIAAKYSKTPAQVILRWHLEHGFSAIPKSAKAHRIAENFDVFGFSLTSDEVARIDALGTGVRGGPDPDSLTLENYGFPIPD